ncbi:MAG: DUF2911 domain-containing protein [Myxococcota bacterium]
MMGAGWVVAALLAGCNSQNKVEPADAAAEAPVAEATPEAPAPEAASMEIPARGDDAGRASKNGQLVHEAGGAKVDVRFGRPEMRGRTVFGGLVTYGQIWRTGADEASTIAFEQDVTVQGQPLGKGVYALFTIPGEDEWGIIFNKQPKQWGAFKYDEAQDALRVTSKPIEAELVEAFDIQGTDDGIALRWAEVSVPLTIAAAGGEAPAEAEDAEAPAEGEAAEGAEAPAAE